MRPSHDHEHSSAGLLAPTPRVSVLVITYNQENYIAQALQSAVDQRTSFASEIVVGEDSSTDRTRAVCLDFQKRYPDKLRVLWSDRNLGFQQNFTRTENACRGEYVAVLEGDDAWIDPFKLDKQVDALATTPSIDACITRARRLLPDGTQEAAAIWDRGSEARVVSLAELAAGDGMMAPTASLVARRDALLALPRWIEDAPVRDAFLFLGLTANKGIYYLPDETCLYRVSASGSWSANYDRDFDAMKVDYSRRMLRAHEQAVQSFGLRRSHLRRRLSSIHLLLAREAFRRRAWPQAIRHALSLDRRYVIERVRHRLGRR